MILLVFFAFLAGVVTILSPCILPILPIVLSGSLAGGKKRPFGIITGFILSFTFFTLALSAIVKATGLSADGLRTIAIVVIALFGLSMITPKFQIWMERIFSKLAGFLPKGSNDSGYVGGIFVGLSLGLLWAPCVGPILASVITLAATSSVRLITILITLAYSIGTAIPMLGITYGGRTLLNRVPWLLSSSQKIQKTFGVFMILTAIAIFFNIDRKFQTYILTTFPNYGVGLTKFEDNRFVSQALQSLTKKPTDNSQIGKPMNEVLDLGFGSAPEFISGGQWFNSEPLSINKLRGNVVLVDFWTYTCINCIRTLPYLKNWHAKYKDKGLVIVGVHTPEFEFEKEAKNVEKAIKDFDLQYPIMQDNDYATWNAYSNRYWPAKYLVDKNGVIQYTHFGEGDYDETEKKIQELLALDMAIDNPTYQIQSRTPEIYLGAARGDYTLIRTEGTWTKSEEYTMPKKGATLSLRFDARKVFLVMRGNGEVKVFLDDNFISTTTVDVNKLYELINLPQAGQHILKLEFLDDNVELYAFTFG